MKRTATILATAAIAFTAGAYASIDNPITADRAEAQRWAYDRGLAKGLGNDPETLDILLVVKRFADAADISVPTTSTTTPAAPATTTTTTAAPSTTTSTTAADTSFRVYISRTLTDFGPRWTQDALVPGRQPPSQPPRAAHQTAGLALHQPCRAQRIPDDRQRRSPRECA